MEIDFLINLKLLKRKQVLNRRDWVKISPGFYYFFIGYLLIILYLLLILKKDIIRGTPYNITKLESGLIINL